MLPRSSHHRGRLARRSRGARPLAEQYARVLDLRLAQNKVLPAAPTITFTRASNNANYFDSAGLLQAAGTDVARFGHVYDSSSGLWVSRGLHVEESRIKRALWSRDQTNAAWAKTNMTNAQDATGLTGVANSASTLTAAAANATSLQTVTIASAEFTYSVYVKRVTGSGDIDITDNNGTNWTTLTGLSSTVWTRHNITRTQANPVFGIRIVTDTDAIEVDFSELEPGAFATSPSATTTATVARAADVATMSDVSWYNSIASTIRVKAFIPVETNSFGTIFRISDGLGSVTNRIAVVKNSSDTSRVSISSAGSTTVDQFFGSGDTWATGENIIAFSVASNDWAGIDKKENSLRTDTTVTMPVDISSAEIGARGSSLFLNGYISGITIWNRRLPNALLQLITQ